jgi:HD-GYP domain-containing protein (c-di-GMP phosphodiesterase class II)
VADWERVRKRVRLHPYLTERILARCASLASVGRVAAAHHERLDGSGYHRGRNARDLDATMRLLAVADVIAAMGEARAHRPALSANDIVREVKGEVGSGRLDALAARVVLSVAGHAPAPGGTGQSARSDSPTAKSRSFA